MSERLDGNEFSNDGENMGIDNVAFVEQHPHSETNKLAARRRIEMLKERRRFHQSICMVNGHCICHEVIPID